MNRLKEYFARHEEQAYIAKMLFIGIAIYPIKESVEWSEFINYILLPTILFIYLRFRVATTRKSTVEVLMSYISLAPLTGYERATVRANYPIVTTALVVLNCAIFAGFMTANVEDYQYIEDYFYFPPPKNDLWNYPVALVAHTFLHADIYHVGGNMVYLWAIGTVLERRLGSRNFLFYYIAFGVYASLIYLIVLRSDIIPTLGSSGAIFGLYGIFAVRCYFKKMSFQIPILGPIVLLVPWLGPLAFLSFNIQVDSLLFFGALMINQVAGAYSQIQTWGSEVGVNYIAHMGGLAGGIIFSFIAGFHKDALEERHLEEGITMVESAIRPRHALSHINKAIELNPDNLEAWLTKARLLSNKRPTTRALEIYEKVLSILIHNDPSEAAKVGRECISIFHGFADKSLYLTLGNIMKDECDYVTAIWLYKKLILNNKLDTAWREQAYFNYALILIRTQEYYMAKLYLTKFISLFPESKYAPVARKRLEML